MKIILPILLTLFISNIAHTQNTVVSSDLELELIQQGYDSGTPDGLVPTANIDTITSFQSGLWAVSDWTGISDFTALERLVCIENVVYNIDLSNNLNLRYLNISLNPITNLDLSQNTVLTTLICQDTRIEYLDLSNNTSLSNLDCGQSIGFGVGNLICLNVKNGNNINFTLFDTSGQPNLSCIEVDNATWSLINWTNTTSASTFSTNCFVSCSSCPMNADFSFVDNGNGSYSFTNSSTGNYTLMDWNFGDGTSSSLTNPNYTFLANGIYTIVLAVADSSVLTGSSCIDYYYSTISVTGVQNPLQCNVGFVMYPDTSSSDIIVVNSSTGNNLTYLWNFGDGNTSNIQNPNHTYTSLGTYYLCLTIDDGNGCVDTYCDSIGNNGVVFKASGFTINVISPSAVGIEENNLSKLSIYPNPTAGIITIDLGATLTNIKATLTNNLGQLILTKNYTATNFINLDINAPKGIYFLQLESNGEVITKKIIKE